MFNFIDRQTETIRGGQGQRAAVEFGIDAGEHRPGFFGSGGEDHLGDGLAQGFDFDAGVDALIYFGYGREVLGIHAADAGFIAGAAHGQGLGLGRHS